MKIWFIVLIRINLIENRRMGCGKRKEIKRKKFFKEYYSKRGEEMVVWEECEVNS